MTEEYWRRWKGEYDKEVWQVNEFWQKVQADLKAKYPGEKHHLELDGICRADNPFIRQIKHSPNISPDTVAELICRNIGCDLQFCMMLKNDPPAGAERLPAADCKREYALFSQCLVKEKERLAASEGRLKEIVAQGGQALPERQERHGAREAAAHAAPPF